MTAPTWPLTLPQAFSVPSHTEEGPDNLIRSEPSVGPAKLRRRSTSATWPLAGQIQMTPTQYDDFRDFVENDIAGRVKPFYFPDRRCGDPLLVRMSSAHKATRSGGNWVVSIELEVLP